LRRGCSRVHPKHLACCSFGNSSKGFRAGHIENIACTSLLIAAGTDRTNRSQAQ
jgi:hypothetical protein